MFVVKFLEGYRVRESFFKFEFEDICVEMSLWKVNEHRERREIEEYTHSLNDEEDEEDRGDGEGRERERERESSSGVPSSTLARAIVYEREQKKSVMRVCTLHHV